MSHSSDGLKVLIKIFVNKKTEAHRTLLFSLIGVYNLVFFWPLVVLLHFMNVELFSSRILETSWIYLLGAHVLFIGGFLWDIQKQKFCQPQSFMFQVYIVCLQYATLITYPIFVNLGRFLIVPVALCKSNRFEYFGLPFVV
jgi:hypothetical protein